MNKHKGGFTIVELLIVIVVIGILAAIVVVSYNGVQNRAATSAMKAEIASVVKQVEMKRVTLGGRYPASIAEMTPLNINKDVYDKTQNNIYYCLDITNDIYAFGLRAKNGDGYMVSNGVTTEVSSVAGLPTCQHIGLTTWDNNTTQAVLQGYTGSTGNYASFLK